MGAMVPASFWRPASASDCGTSSGRNAIDDDDSDGVENLGRDDGAAHRSVYGSCGLRR